MLGPILFSLYITRRGRIIDKPAVCRKLCADDTEFYRAFHPYPTPASTAVRSRSGGAADAEIKVISDENTELKGSPFKTWSRSVYCHACYAYCQGFLSCLFLPFRSIHRHFPKICPELICSCVIAVANTGSCAGPQNKIGHLLGAGSPVECSWNINRLQNMCYCFAGFAFRNCGYNLSCG